jgi:hypothetical protein
MAVQNAMNTTAYPSILLEASEEQVARLLLGEWVGNRCVLDFEMNTTLNTPSGALIKRKGATKYVVTGYDDIIVFDVDCDTEVPLDLSQAVDSIVRHDLGQFSII